MDGCVNHYLEVLVDRAGQPNILVAEVAVPHACRSCNRETQGQFVYWHRLSVSFSRFFRALRNLQAWLKLPNMLMSAE